MKSMFVWDNVGYVTNAERSIKIKIHKFKWQKINWVTQAQPISLILQFRANKPEVVQTKDKVICIEKNCGLSIPLVII